MSLDKILKEDDMKKKVLFALFSLALSISGWGTVYNCLHIQNGWKLFGLSGGIPDVNQLFHDKGDSVNAIWAYDSSSKRWKFYSPNTNLTSVANSMSNIDSLNNIAKTEGFWVQGKKDEQICTDSNEELSDSNQTQPTTPTSIVFSDGPTMQVARMAHWIVPLPNDGIEVIGGHGTGFTSLASAEKWDATTNTFTTTAMNATHDIGAMVKLSDGRYFISGGAANSGVAPGNNIVEIFDPTDRTFTAAGTMLKRRTGQAATQIGNRVLIVGGWYDTDSTTTPEIYDLNTHTSTLTANLNTPRSYPWVLPTDDGKAVVFWGMPPHGGTALDSVELYNPADNNFTTLSATMLNEAGWAPLISHLNRPISSQKMNNGKYLLWGHKDDITALITFDPATKSFSKFDTTPALPNVSSERVYDVLVNNLHNVAILLGVKSGVEPQVLTVYLVDLSNGSLTKIGDGYTLPSDFHVTYSANIILKNDRIMITGGNSQIGYSTNFSPVAKTLFLDFQ